MQFVNIAIIILLVYFKLGAVENGNFSKIVPILKGEYTDFTALWYYNVGATLCVTLFINIFSPHISKLTWFFLSAIQRCFDRGGSLIIKKSMKNKKDDRCNTKREL